MQTYYYASTIRSITTALTDMFNDLVIKRLDSSGVVVKTIPVPIKFAPVDKIHHYIQEKESDEKYYLKLPSIAVSLSDFTYAKDRACGKNEIRHLFDESVGLDSIEEFITDVNPTPYDLGFKLSIIAEKIDDFLQIVENILPYFNPTLYLRVKEFSSLNLERDLPVTIQDFNMEYQEEQLENTKRIIIGNITLIVNAWMYRPISDAKVIKEIQSRYYVNQFITSADDAIDNSYANQLISKYQTSGFISTSAISAISQNVYDFSATSTGYIFNTSADIYTFVSATPYL